MSSNARIGIVFASALAAAGPVWAASDNAPDRPPIHTIGIASTCGGEFWIESIGTLRFDNSEDRAPVPDWRIDDLITTAMSKSLADHYTVTPVTMAATDVAREPGTFLGFKLSPAVLAGLEPDPTLLRAALEKAGSFDVFVLVWPMSRPDTIENLDIGLTGVGLYQRNLFGHHKKPRIFTACHMTLVDGHSFAVIDQESLSMPYKPGTFASGLREAMTLDRGVYFMLADPAASADSVAAITPQQRQIILGSLSSLLDQEIPDTLQELNLIP